MSVSDDKVCYDAVDYFDNHEGEEGPSTPPERDQDRLCAEAPHLESFLKDLGLQQHYQEKLTLNTVLQIQEKTITDEEAKCSEDLARDFLKKVMMANVTARSMKFNSACKSNSDVSSETEDELDTLIQSYTSDMINPLDVVTALFLCSDGFVQQDLALKMSMSQFSVPLLLPSGDTKQCTLMLWALRDIVKKYRPQSLSGSKGFTEERIVLTELPMISFVRLGKCSLSKSEILNKLLSNSQQYHDTFVHQNMECGDCPRKISNGLTEISWYLPCGNKNMDIFSEPVAVANLRGDIASFETQFSFLCQTSAAIFVFFDNLQSRRELLTNNPNKAKIFLVGNHHSESFSLDELKQVAKELGLNKSRIILKTRQRNESDFVNILQETVRAAVGNSQNNMKVEQMADVAHELGILVDEDLPECQKGRNNADAITAEIQDPLQYKESQLPLQGQIWRDLTRLEKEECRLENAGSENIEHYKSGLQEEKMKLRQKQNSTKMSPAMENFINAISLPGKDRCYFLKWMRMNLDNLSRERLSGLRERYKENCLNSENKEEIKDIDKQLSNSSLGIEHFFREMGQIYEAAVSLPENHPSRQQFRHLPNLCAELLLDGFPLELVDGDASNIPLRWVTDVLTQLNVLVSPENRIKVVTVLGVQSTGKSTLLNTMFGVQFAVSSGRCTRGAFMLLIRINQDLKDKLKCDFVLIIDTEGLKSPELAQLDESYEHDNELATLVVGLSDIAIINIAMENSTDMKDILQIVVHSFLRMTKVGKKPRCQFVHQNVSDVSAHEKNLRDRKLLLQQLNEMTQASAQMEKEEDNKSLTDVMEYNPDSGNCYIPGLWNGTPPMAPINAGYSEAVYDLKTNIVQSLEDCESHTSFISDFTKWMKSLWTAVKHENFIFSFRNSLVADAYVNLCTEYNRWEWEFRKEMYTWVTTNETKISNFGSVMMESDISDIGKFLRGLIEEASKMVSTCESKLLKNLKEYFQRTGGRIHLVEGYRAEFSNAVKSLCKEMRRSAIDQLNTAAEMRQGMVKLDRIKETHTKEVEEKVRSLIKEFRKGNVQVTDMELNDKFNQMWDDTVKKLNIDEMEIKNIMDIVSHHLWTHLSPKGSGASELLNKQSLSKCGLEPFTWTPQKTQYSFNKCKHDDHTPRVQRMADSIVAACRQCVKEKVKRKHDYHDTFILEILQVIDTGLENNRDLKTDITFEVALKQHICADAARQFQKMHEDFIQVNDPHRCLSQNKEKFRADFKDVFHERDQCHKKAQEFTDRCLRPAVRDFVNRSLGPDIIGEMLTCHKFSTRMHFQYSVLLDLLSKNKFEDYLNYCSNYEDYVKWWILDQILEHFSDGSKLYEMEDKHQKLAINSIKDVVKQAQNNEDGSLTTFVKDFCKNLDDILVISQDALGAFMILNNVNIEIFANWLMTCVEDMGKPLKEKVKQTDIRTKLEEVRINPQNELVSKIIGCRRQCPFCKVPCDAGGQAHTEHWASMHRSQGLGGCRWENSEKLITDICSSLVVSDKRFRCSETKNQWHPHKKYREIFPDWRIAGDGSLEASDYWKYVMTKFNTEFAKEHRGKPAEIPSTWRNIDAKQAQESLRMAFFMK